MSTTPTLTDEQAAELLDEIGEHEMLAILTEALEMVVDYLLPEPRVRYPALYAYAALACADHREEWTRTVLAAIHADEDEILAVLQKLNDEGLTLIVVTHDSAVARRAKRRLRLDRGTVRDITR